MIKAVDIIPFEKKKNGSQRTLIQKDIKEAIGRGIYTFEFVGDEYNYKYLDQYAREEAKLIARDDARKALGAEMEKAGIKGYYVSVSDVSDYEYIIIYGIKEQDRKHVYCRINPDKLEEYISNKMEQIIERKGKVNE